MLSARVVAGAFAPAALVGAIMAGPAALDAVRDATPGAVEAGISRTDREQARNVVHAWRMNGPYAECITALGYDGILWQSTIALAEGLAGDPALAALYDTVRAREGDENPQWNTRQFTYDSDDCRRQNPEQPPPPQLEDVEDWAALMAEAEEHGWSPDDPFALDCDLNLSATHAACQTFDGR